jgi:hypothetical protein
VGYGHEEATLALELRDLVHERLARSGHEVDRDGATGENLRLAIAIEKARAASLALELHFNGTLATATGTECFGTSDKRAICIELARATATVLGIGVRGGDGGFKLHTESQHGARGLGFCRAGGVLLEVCWMNQHDLDRYLPRKDAVADAVATVLARHVAEARADLPPAPPARPRRATRPGTRSTLPHSPSAPQRRRRG